MTPTTRVDREARDPVAFARAGGMELRAYQREVMRAIVAAVIAGQGGTFAVMFPRQSGKNELQAQIEAYLLCYYATVGGEMVKVSPTFVPQALVSMRRLERVLRDNPHAEGWTRERGFVYRLREASIAYLSAAPEASIVGATASLLLEVDEAQDVLTAKYDREVLPMAAATNAVRVLWGTAWTGDTLLAREMRSAGNLGRAFTVRGDRVAREVPAYGAFLNEQISRLGRDHPAVKTQFFCEALDGEAGMFPPGRLAKMQGEPLSPPPGALYALLIDVGGEESRPAELGPSPRRDATAATVVWIDLSTRADPYLRAATYRPVERRAWTGTPHADLFGELSALAERYRAAKIVIDATGVGAGLASFLARAFPGRVVPFLFTSASKSKLGWDFLALVDAGRWKEGAFSPGLHGDLQDLFLRQLKHCRYTLLPGPNRLMRWGVPDGARDADTGEYVHDDLVLSAALAAVLDRESLALPSAPLLIPGKDPLGEMTGF